MRTDGAKRIRIANRLSGMHVSAKAKLCERGANPRQGVRRTGEGSKVKIAQLVRDDMSIQVSDNETERLDCHVADAPRNDINLSQPCLRKGRRIAFTLAEVLITLGIIGVVAALTLPSIVNNYKKQVTVTKLKRAYTALGQVAQMSLADNGTVDFSEGTVATQESVKEFFSVYWLPYFKGAEVDTSPAGPWQGSNIAYKYQNGSEYNTSIYTNYDAGRVLFSTPDGVSYFIIITRWNSEDKEHYWTPIFNSKQEVVVDINGIKSPNVFGKDIFRFWIDFKDGIVRTDYYTKTDTEVNSSCNNSGLACATKIIRDGWKITYPY